MIYYMIRHKTTGEFMPELRRTRGYSFWNPSKVNTEEILSRKLLGVPRLFANRINAHHSIIAWNSMPNSYMRGRPSYDGEYDNYLNTSPDGRSKSDLEIVEVNIEVKV